MRLHKCVLEFLTTTKNLEKKQIYVHDIILEPNIHFDFILLIYFNSQKNFMSDLILAYHQK